MSDKTTPTVGKLLDGTAGRDAIHFALAPVVASTRFVPGQHIGVTNRAVAVNYEPFVGIVDPFLTRTVQEGERFWLFLYPNTITGLRHVWTHPAFTTKAFEIETTKGGY